MIPEYFIGALSGTSIDGIDVALVGFEPHPRLLATHTLPYPDSLRRELLALCVPGGNEIDRLGQADVLVGRVFAQAVQELVTRQTVPAERILAIGSHGQTIRHRPGLNPPFTLQIGDPNVIAALTGIPVVGDFRRKDMALGGQGAPLVPAFHEAVFRSAKADRVVVNIGGIANLTILPRDAAAPIRGFDTGPGNTLMDTWARRVLGTAMDQDGALAQRGTIATPLLAALLADAYFAAPPPKSTGPEYFSLAWLERHLAPQGTVEAADVQATLLALTARSIAAAITAPADVFVCGGGAQNPVLMAALQALLPNCKVAKTDTLGVAAGWVEAMAFAWMARQRWHAEPANCPGVTGAQRPAVLGGLYLPQ